MRREFNPKTLHDPYGIRMVGIDAMREWELKAFNILVDLGVLDEGSMAPWNWLEDIAAPQTAYPELKPDEVWEQYAPPPASQQTRPQPPMAKRELIL